MSRREIVVIGAGPAGLAAATTLAGQGADVLVLDEQPAPGGQIFRGVEGASPDLRRILGDEYARGQKLAESFRASGASYRPGASVWQITPAREIWFSDGEQSERIEAGVAILATGAMERPVPIAGWTLPGAMTAGAVQILLKSAGMVPDAIVLAGSGPLLLLLAAQLLAAGAPPRAIVDTAPPHAILAALPRLPTALTPSGLSLLAKGLSLRATLRANGIAHYRGATDLRLEGSSAVEAISFSVRGENIRIATSVVALHEGVIPAQQAARSVGCAFAWDAAQNCFCPVTDRWGNSSVDGILIAGDAAGIFGARAAEHAGHVVAAEALRRLGRVDAARRDALAAAHRRAWHAEASVRPFLDALFQPPKSVLRPPDDVIVCRCEEITAGAVRNIVGQGCLGPNQAKSFLRVGMGPCQGRTCGPVVAELIAEARGVPVGEVGYFRIRPPLKPITVGELAGASS